MRLVTLLVVLYGALALASAADTPTPIKILFLGDNGHHRPAERFRQLQPVLAARGIDLQYTDKLEALNAQTLAAYDGLMIYANQEKISPEQEKALLDFVESGKGFIPLHCASYCFLNSLKYIDLVGAQFLRHGTGTFRPTIASADHPLMKGFRGFESWDETYVHTKHNDKDRTVLEYRNEGANREPWTWVRTQGKGRVFYTAWGHDERTWGHPGFQNLVERGIRWAVGRDVSIVAAYVDRPEMTPKRTDVKPFEYVEGNIPFYPPGERWGTIGEPIRKVQKPLDAAESMKHFVTPAGFEVQLFAAEPDIGKPICMNWDERGRLWICETVDYPNERQPEGEGRDRIRICEDTDGDGRADKFTIFAEKLSIPTSLTFCRGGVIVHQLPHTLYLKDTDGDDLADVRVVFFTGWGTGDTHAGPSNLRYGLDNWYYGIVGYSGFRGTVAGEQLSFGQGFYRFQASGGRKPPESSGTPPTRGADAPRSPGIAKLEFLRSTNNNSWGVGFSEEGLLFGSTANGNPSVHLPIPNRYYERVRGWSSSVLPGIAGDPKFEPITDKVRQVDFHGKFTAAAGHALYTARTYPKEYWNRTAFVCEPTGHLAATFTLTPDGASFRSRPAWNLLASDDEWSSPIMAEVGPDGNVWVIDWYNIVVQHNPTPAGFRTGRGAAYETPLRDKKHGRVYRVVWKGERRQGDKESGRQGERKLSLAASRTEQLVETLKHPNMLWRLHAQRLLVERGEKDVVAALVELAKDQSVDEIGLNVGVIHALWTLHGLGLEERSLAVVTAALKHPSAGVRLNALAILPPYRGLVSRDALLADANPQVRLAALLSIADMTVPGESVRLLDLISAENQGRDRWLRDGTIAAAAGSGTAFLRSVAAKRFGEEPSSAVGQLVERVAEHVGRKSDAQIAALLPLLVEAHPTIAAATVQGLERGWPRDQGRALQLSNEEDAALAKLAAKLPEDARARLIQLLGRWDSLALYRESETVLKKLSAKLDDEKLSDTERLAVAGQLMDIRKRDAELAKTLLKQVKPQAAPDVGRGLLEILGRSESPGIANLIVERFATFTPMQRTTAVRILLGRSDWAAELVEALQKGVVPVSELSLDQRQGLAAHPRWEVAEKAKIILAKGGGLPNADREKVLQELMPLTKKAGDAVAGKLIMKNQCLKCHTHMGEGTKIGPDLSGMAVHPKHELLVHIIDPSRSVEGNYRQYTVLTKDGKIIFGLLASESKTAIELYDVEGKKHTLLREDIDELKGSEKSLMPDGFEKLIPPNDLVNLLEYMTQRGKYLPLPLDKVATIVTTKGMFNSEGANVERLVFRDWSPKMVDDVPFVLVDPQGDRTPNAIMLHGANGQIPPKMPKSVRLACGAPAKAVHLLGGVSGWGWPASEKGTTSVTVRLHYAEGQTEDHALKNGEHFADYIRRVDVPGSKFAFSLRGQQIRYLTIHPKRGETIKDIEFLKGDDVTSPVIMAVTVEGH
jgi:hypothetical protein